MATAVVNVGIAAINNAASGGPKVNVTTFRIGSSFGYTPLVTMTSLQGVELFNGTVSNYTVLANDLVEYECILDQSVGNFAFGEIGLYLATGELFSLTALSELRSKIAQNLGAGELGNKIIIRIQLSIDNAPYVLDFQDISLTQRLPWADDFRNATYVDASTFQVTGDVTGFFQVGRAVRASEAGPLVYSYVATSVFSAGSTTITLQDPVLSPALTVADYGIMEPGEANAEAYIRRAIRTIGYMGVWIANANPILTMRDTDANANEQYVRLLGDRLRAYADDLVANSDIMFWTRTLQNVQTVVFPSGNIGVGGAPLFKQDVFGTQRVQGGTIQSGQINVSLAPGATQNLNPAGFADTTTLRVSTDVSGSSLGGVVNSTGGKYSRFVNLGPGVLTFLHEALGSTAGNRFSLPGGLSASFVVGGVAEFWYDVTTGRWRLTSSGFSSITTGGMIMWDRPLIDIPAGWFLCDGSNGTQDMRDRVPIGAGSTYAVNAIGGATTATPTMQSAGDHTHTMGAAGSHFHFTSFDGSHSHIGPASGAYALTINDMPAHTHRLRGSYGAGGYDGGGNAFLRMRGDFGFQDVGAVENTGGSQAHSHPGGGATSTDGSHNHSTDTAGSHVHGVNNAGSHAHIMNAFSILPPYRALYFIRKS